MADRRVGARWWRKPFWATLLAATACACAYLVLRSDHALGALERTLRDALLRLSSRHTPEGVAIVAVDDASLSSYGPWPWPRARLAELVRNVAAFGARAVVVDILLVEPRDDDEELSRALTQVPSVLAVAIAPAGWLRPPSILAVTSSLGHATFEPDRDGVVRRIATTKQVDDQSYPALAWAALHLLDPRRPLPLGRSLRPAFRLSWDELPVVPAWRVLQRSPEVARLQGRIVFVGVTGAGLGDRVAVATAPRGQPLPGVAVHAGATQCLLRGSLLTPLGGLMETLLVGLLAAAAWQVWSRPALRRPRLLALALLAFPGVASATCLVWLGWEVAAVIPTGLVALVLLSAQLQRAQRTRAATTRLVATLHPHDSPPTTSQKPEWEQLEELARAIAARRAAEQEAQRVVAHELKTPLTAVRGLTQLLADYDLTPEERTRVAALASGEAQRLHDMVLGLLDLEQLTRRDFAATAKVLNLGQLVEERVALLAAGSGRAIRWERSGEQWVKGDLDGLRRVVDNLLGNALAYSPRHEAVTVRLERAGSQAQLTVADRGPGVPFAEREKIFARFVRGTAAAHRPGLGLGLALVAEVVGWHGGTVELTDTPGGGATFIVRLPLSRGGGD